VPPSPTRRRKAHQLPPGRHGLPRNVVRDNQRRRILTAVAEAVAGVGYAAMTVEDVIKLAGVSRRTFYEHFTSKEDAFLASYDDIAAQLLQALVTAFEGETTFVARVEACMRAFLTLLAAQPAYARMCIVEVLVAGPAAVERRTAVLGEFAALIDRAARAERPRPARPPALTSQLLVGGVHEVVHARVLRDETPALPALLPDLAFAVLLPFAGQDVAAAEHRRLRRRRRS